MSQPANPNTLGTKTTASTEEKVTEEKMPLGSDLHCEERGGGPTLYNTNLYTEGFHKLVTQETSLVLYYFIKGGAVWLVTEIK